MKYVGSKNRLSKELAPIIQSYVDAPECKGYIEPFVGGANMIDKIKHPTKFGFDTHKYLIALLQKAQRDTSDFPKTFDENLYKDVKMNLESKYEDWFIGLVGFCSFGGKWFGGYPRSFKADGVTPRDMPNEIIRNIKKQAPNLRGIKFRCRDFRSIDLNKVQGYVIYCDPPYRDTTKYATGDFPYEDFYAWCRKAGTDNTVLISEYWMPEDFDCIWEKSVVTGLNSKKASGDLKNCRTEKLFIYRKKEIL